METKRLQLGNVTITFDGNRVVGFGPTSPDAIAALLSESERLERQAKKLRSYVHQIVELSRQ